MPKNSFVLKSTKQIELICFNLAWCLGSSGSKVIKIKAEARTCRQWWWKICLSQIQADTGKYICTQEIVVANLLPDTGSRFVFPPITEFYSSSGFTCFEGFLIGSILFSGLCLQCFGWILRTCHYLCAA